MAGFNPDTDRKIIPRWRTFKETLSLGELGPYTLFQAHEKVTSDFLFSKVNGWQRYRTKFHAADLVGAAITLGRERECLDAARYLLLDDVNSSEWMRRLSHRALQTQNNLDERPSLNVIMEQSDLRAQIGIFRQLLRIEPRDAIIWADLSRIYAILGQNAQAARCMTVAIQLAMDNRFILRSAGRLWLHLEDPEKAHYTILQSKISRHDPWLLAAEVAIADLLNKTPRFIKTGRQKLSEKHISASHKSELASALATLEFSHGKIKHTRRLFRKSLEQPNENSIAQAAWAFKHNVSIALNFDSYSQVEHLHEASYFDLFYRGQWEQAISKCQSWESDQPFSAEPYICGSYVLLTMLENYHEGKKFAEKGLVANPLNFTLLNNIAFADINNGNFDNAKKVLSRIERVITVSSLSKQEQTVLKATQGLLAFRMRDIERGRRLYLEARKMAQAEQNTQVHAAVAVYHALEEITHSQQDHTNVVSEARKILSSVPKSVINPVFKVLEQKLETSVVSHK